MPSIGPKSDPELKGPQLVMPSIGPKLLPPEKGLKLELELEFPPHGIQDSIKLSPPLLLLLLSHGIHGDALAILDINKVILKNSLVIVVIFYLSPKFKNFTGCRLYTNHIIVL
jgi:hypothetical protein